MRFRLSRFSLLIAAGLGTRCYAASLQQTQPRHMCSRDASLAMQSKTESGTYSMLLLVCIAQQRGGPSRDEGCVIWVFQAHATAHQDSGALLLTGHPCCADAWTHQTALTQQFRIKLCFVLVAGTCQLLCALARTAYLVPGAPTATTTICVAVSSYDGSLDLR